MKDATEREWLEGLRPEDQDEYFEDESMVDLGGGMVVPLSELLEEDDA